LASFDRIRTHGFRHWYERQLIECHAWLVSCFLGMICAASGIEVSGPTPLPHGADPDLERIGETVWLQARYRRCAHDWVL